MAKVLITGGAGYVGSHACALLQDQGHDVTVLDDLSTGRKELILTKNFVHARVGDQGVLSKLFAQNQFECVMHFAASTIVAESFQKPELYLENNLGQTETLVQDMLAHGIDKLIFSSSCTIFGNSTDPIIEEKHEKKPISPYGESKLQCERLFEKTKDLKSITLRYFNAAGADPELRVGEWHDVETRLIPLAIKAARENTELKVFGSDYPNPDGTCVRDYVHVWDIAHAHAKALNRILRHPVEHEDYNIGSEKRFSVLEVIKAVEKISGKKIRVVLMPRRPGDSPKMIASGAKAQQRLAFEPKFSELKTIIESAYAWDKKINTHY